MPEISFSIILQEYFLYKLFEKLLLHKAINQQITVKEYPWKIIRFKWWALKTSYPLLMESNICFKKKKFLNLLLAGCILNMCIRSVIPKFTSFFFMSPYFLIHSISLVLIFRTTSLLSLKHIYSSIGHFLIFTSLLDISTKMFHRKLELIVLKYGKKFTHHFLPQFFLVSFL